MENEKFDARITVQMKSVIVQLEDHDLVQAEQSVRLLAEEVQMVTAEAVRERKVANVKKRLHCCLGKIQPVYRLDQISGGSDILACCINELAWGPLN